MMDKGKTLSIHPIDESRDPQPCSRAPQASYFRCARRRRGAVAIATTVAPKKSRGEAAGPCGSLSSAAMAGGPADARKLFLFTTTQNYFGLRPELWDQPPPSSCPEVNNFLDDGNQMLLRVQRSEAGLAFSNTVGRLPGYGRAFPPSGPRSLGLA